MPGAGNLWVTSSTSAKTLAAVSSSGFATTRSIHAAIIFISASPMPRLVTDGVLFAPVLLHTGVSSLETGEPPLAERFRVPATTAALVSWVRGRGGRVIAVGTTVARALESSVAGDDVLASEGWTNLVLGPARPARVVDGIVTGLHAPEASHLLLLEAVAGAELVQRAYDAAVERRYLWHEFGDVSLLTRR